MNETILAVDDEPLILNAYQRSLGDRYTILTAEGPTFALSALKAAKFSVILTDLKMPGIDGIELLRQARELQPDAVRMLISGHADLHDAVESVNNAGIFRLLLKPCPSDDLASSLDAALGQYRLVTAERALLEQTLNGAIQALTDILDIFDPEAFGTAQLRRQMAGELAKAMKAPSWEFEMAAQLCEIGRATIPSVINEKLKKHMALSEAERLLFERVPEFTSRLIRNIPRIEGVAEAVLYQNKNFDGSGFPYDDKMADDIPIAGQALHAINSLMAACRKGEKPLDAIAVMKQKPELYNQDIVAALGVCVPFLENGVQEVAHRGPQEMSLSDLETGMVLLSDIRTRDGLLVLGAGTQLSGAQIQRVRNFAQLNSINEPILVDIRD
jgi:response regulator RpfG family c-di-GMP phosphodiesterase